MGKVKEYLREQINKAAGNFLCDPAEGDLYDAYLKLKEAQESEQGSDYASNYVDIPESISAFNSVDQIVDLIECAVDAKQEVPEFLANIDWPLLKKQKQDLLNVIENDDTATAVSLKEKESLEGILNLIDSIQDYVVDTCGLNQDLVFELDHEDDEIVEGKP